MAAQQDRTARMFAPRRVQHRQETPAPRAHQGRISARLVDHQHIARTGRGQVGPMGVVFRQIRRAQPGDAVAGALFLGRGDTTQHQGFDQRRARRVEMHPQRVDQQADRPAPGDMAPRAARQDGPQESVLDRDQGRARVPGDGAAAPGGRAGAPDRHAVAGAGQSQPQLPARKRQDPAQARFPPEAAAECEKPPVLSPGGPLFVDHAAVTAPGSELRWQS